MQSCQILLCINEELLLSTSLDRNSFFNLKYTLVGLTKSNHTGKSAKLNSRPDSLSSQPFDQI